MELEEYIYKCKIFVEDVKDGKWKKERPTVKDYIKRKEKEYSQLIDWLTELKELKTLREQKMSYKQVQEDSIGEFATDLLGIASNNTDFYELKDGTIIEAIEIENLDKIIYERLAQLKEKTE